MEATANALKTTPNTPNLAALEQATTDARARLLQHPIYDVVDSLPALRQFMQVHVFAVWDFMSLIKRLQGDLAPTALPWRPPQSRPLARFVNEVILSEESDIDAHGNPASHLEMYLEGMREVGASTRTFEIFLRHLERGGSPIQAMRALGVPQFVQTFVGATLGCAHCGTTVEVAASFLFGREDLIPQMFQRLVTRWDTKADQIPGFRYYLVRHIDLDGDEHGPIARQGLATIAGTDEWAWERAQRAAVSAIEARIALWDGVVDQLTTTMNR